jgi:hypothetical protein
MGPVCVYDERAETLVALQGFPEQHDHFRCPCQRLVTTRQIGCVSLELFNVSFGCDCEKRSSYRLVQYPRHTVNQELEVLWPVEATEEMPEEVLRRRPIARFGDGVQDQNQEELQTVRDEYLSLVLENNVIVGHAPCCGVVFEGLQESASARVIVVGAYRVKQRA